MRIYCYKNVSYKAYSISQIFRVLHFKQGAKMTKRFSVICAALLAANTMAFAANDDDPWKGTSWPDLPKQTSFPSTISTVPDFAYQVKSEGKAKKYPTPGVGMLTQTGGSTVYAGGVSINTTYFLSMPSTAGSHNVKNQIAPAVRIGIGKQWDITVVSPMTFIYNRSGDHVVGTGGTNPGFGTVGTTTVTLHKQHFAKKFEEASLAVATEYSLGIPTNSGMNGAWGMGLGLGMTWQYRNMSAIFNFSATTYSNSRNPAFSSRGGYHFAFTNNFYAGVEYMWDSVPYGVQGGSTMYSQAIGAHTLYFGPMFGIKVPKLKNSAFAFGGIWDTLQKTESGVGKEPWKFVSRLLVNF